MVRIDQTHAHEKSDIGLRRPLASAAFARAAGDASQAFRTAFSLIEMLIVIAIISILIAIIFPVFGSILENGRESNTMSNMQQISSALALYKLDNQSYPPVLFGYAMQDPANPGQCIPMNQLVNQANSSTYLLGLYPQYVKDWHVFTSANNPVDSQTACVQENVNVFPSSGTATRFLQATTASSSPASPYFYSSDAMDISPLITSTNQVSTTQFVPRYQTSWLSYPPTVSSYYPSSTVTDPDYSRQLRWELPPSNTYVTSTTYHVGNANRVLVLFASGTVRKVNVVDGSWSSPVMDSTEGYTLQHADYIDGASDISAIADSGCTGCMDANAAFWRYTGGQ